MYHAYVPRLILIPTKGEPARRAGRSSSHTSQLSRPTLRDFTNLNQGNP